MNVFKDMGSKCNVASEFLRIQMGKYNEILLIKLGKLSVKDIFLIKK